MIDAATFIGEPKNFKGICYIYPPKVKDVVANPNFGVYQKILTLAREDIQEILKDKHDYSPLEYILVCAYNDQDFKKVIEESFFFFTHDRISFSYEEKKIIFHQTGGFVGEVNFLDFQNEIRLAMGLPPLKEEPPIDPNEDPRIRKMKEKIRERDRVKARQAAKGNTSDGISLATCLTAISCMGIGLTPLNIGELSYAAVGPIMNMMQEKEKYDIDIRSLLAGASSKKVKPKYWIRNHD